MAANAAPFISPEEYLEIDSKSDHPSEYLNGKMVEIEGSTPNDARISGNLVAATLNSIWRHNSKCRAYPHTLRVHTPRTGLYAYPDLVITRDEEEVQR